MQKFFSNAQDVNGKAIVGASVAVYDAGTSNLATIYADDETTPLSNPLTSDAFGRFQFKADNDVYDVVVTKGTFNQRVNGLVFYDPDDAGAPSTFGTMAAQDADAVAITGGTLDGTAIGSVDPSTGLFTATFANVADSASSTIGTLNATTATVTTLDAQDIGGKDIQAVDTDGVAIANATGSNIVTFGAGDTQNTDFSGNVDVTGNVSTDGFVDVAEIAAPATPASGRGRIYAKTDGKLYFKDDAGVEYDLTAGGAGIGVGQTWQDVSSSRSLGTTYTNSTGKPIQVIITQAGNSGTFVVDGLTAQTGSNNASSIRSFFSAIIPNGDTYSLTGGNTPLAWLELR